MNRKVDLSKFTNSEFKVGKPLITVFTWYLINAVIFNSYLFPFYSLKRFLLTLFGAEIGKGVIIKPKVSIKYPWKLSIGNHSWIGEKVWIDNLSKVTIDNNVCISQGALILTGNHNYKSQKFDLTSKKIIIKEGVWIGAKSVVCAGVTCHPHAVLTVGSIATKDLYSYEIYQGNPALSKGKRVIQ